MIALGTLALKLADKKNGDAATYVSELEKRLALIHGDVVKMRADLATCAATNTALRDQVVGLLVRISMLENTIVELHK